MRNPTSMCWVKRCGAAKADMTFIRPSQTYLIAATCIQTLSSALFLLSSDVFVTLRCPPFLQITWVVHDIFPPDHTQCLEAGYSHPISQRWRWPGLSLSLRVLSSPQAKVTTFTRSIPNSTLSRFRLAPHSVRSRRLSQWGTIHEEHKDRGFRVRCCRLVHISKSEHVQDFCAGSCHRKAGYRVLHRHCRCADLSSGASKPRHCTVSRPFLVLHRDRLNIQLDRYSGRISLAVQPREFRVNFKRNSPF